jgi:zinc protease
MKKSDRSIIPSPSSELKFTLPEVVTFKLANALDVIFVKRSSLPILRMNLIINGGSNTDPAGKKGLANLFTMMIDEGAGGYNGLELMDEFDILGSSFDISCNNDGLYLGLRTLKENADRSIDLFSKIMTEPHFDEISFAREKRKLLTRLMQLKDDPEEIASSVFEYTVFGKDDPYAFPSMGYEDDIKDITVEEIKNFYKNYFVPNNSAMIVVGDITKDELTDKLNKYLYRWAPKILEIENYKCKAKESTGIYIIHKDDSVQSEIRIGHISAKRDKRDVFSRTLMNNILGGQFSSRINLNLREDKGYTYGAFSRFNYFKENAIFYVSTSAGIENTGKAIVEIIKELNLIREGVTEKELDFAKTSTIRKFPSNFETNRQVAYNLTTKYLYNLPDDYYDSYINKIREVTIEEVNKAAIDHIHSDKLTILIVGDKNKLIPQLKEITSEKIIELDYLGKEIAVL